MTWNNQEGTPQRRVIDDINNDGFSIVKQGINNQDVAETIANKFEAKGIPAEVIDGGIYEEQGQDPVATATQNTLDKLGSRVGAAAGSNIDQVTTAYEQKILDRMGKRFGLPPGSTAEQVQAAQQAYLDKNDPAAAAQYKQNMANIDAGGTHAANQPVQLAPVAEAAPAEYTPKVGEEILWRPRFAKMVPVPVTVVAVAPGKLKIKLQSPRMIQNYGKDTIVVDLEKSDVTPKQGIAEADRLPRPDNWKPPVPAPRPRLAPQKRLEIGDTIGFTPQKHDATSSGKVFKAEVLEIGGRLGRSGILLKLLNPEDVAANGGNSTMKVSSMISKIQNPYVEPAQQGVTESRQRRLNEAMLMEDPVYRKFKKVGRYIAERKMSEKEILQVFADAESGMTDKGTGANRTFLGRGKDTTMDFAGGVKDAMTSVLNSIQNSTPVAAVDVAYDQATDALAKVAGGQKGAVMNAIKKYRNLVKQYPKTAGFAKAALVAIAGLATGGAGLPVIAGLTYALDSAIKGDKLSSVLGKGAGAAALTAAGQAAFGGDAAADTVTPDSIGLPDVPTDGGTYTVMQGDQGGFIAQANGVPFKDLKALNPDITNWNKLPVGTELQLPPSGPNTGSVWQGTDMSSPGAGMSQADMGNFRADNLARMQDQADAAYYAGKPDDFGIPARSNDAVGTGMPGSAPTTNPIVGKNTFPDGTPIERTPYGNSSQEYMKQFGGSQPNQGGSGFTGTTVAGIPVIPGQPLNPTQMAVANMSMQSGNQLSPVVQAAYDLAKRGALRESIKFKILPAEKLIDQKSTVMSWALNESVGRRSISLNLTTLGTYTVFENVDRYRKAIMELKGVPGSTRPDYYRPDMMDAPTKPDKKPGLIGRGLNWLDKKAGQVGGALSNFGHQFTTGVTKEKLKMNWHQAGKPSDSDQLAAWLAKQGVPQEVVTTVYGKMGIPYVAPASAEPAVEPGAPATEPATPAAGGAQKSLPFYGKNPTTGKAWTRDELLAKDATTAPAAPAAAAAQATTAQNPAGFNASNVMNLPGMEKYAKQPAPAKTANFGASPGGYSNVTTSFKPTTPAKSPAAPAAPAGTRVTSGGPTPDEQARLAQRIAQATAKPVAEMLRMVETKEDVAKIKQFIDRTFVKYGAVTESAFVVRNRLIEHVTQVGAQRRREHAQMS